MDLRDKKLEEIEEAYAKYLEDHPQEDVNKSQQSDIDVTQSMHLGEEE